MARTSKKNEALVAALDIVQDAGVNAVTYDSLSQATGMTKSGLIYHFPTATTCSWRCTASVRSAGRPN